MQHYQLYTCAFARCFPALTSSTLFLLYVYGVAFSRLFFGKLLLLGDFCCFRENFFLNTSFCWRVSSFPHMYTSTLGCYSFKSTPPRVSLFPRSSGDTLSLLCFVVSLPHPETYKCARVNWVVVIFGVYCMNASRKRHFVALGGGLS